MAGREKAVKKEMPQGLWTKCDGCDQIIYNKELEENLSICPKCGYYFRLRAARRIALIADKNSFREINAHLESADPLGFVDAKPYRERIREARKKTNMNEAVVTGMMILQKKKVMIGVLDFSFMGGSMGTVVGEKITRLIEKAIEEKAPVVIVSASGGARMQESIFSLMQMAKTNAACEKLARQRLPFISVLTDPTTGGVTASFAMCADIILAEPGALIGFAGPRVIEQTIRQTLPE